MNVGIKNMNVDMQLGNSGVEFEVKNNKDEFLGDLRIGKATIEWCKGKTRNGNGVQVSWDNLINFFENQN